MENIKYCMDCHILIIVYYMFSCRHSGICKYVDMNTNVILPDLESIISLLTNILCLPLGNGCPYISDELNEDTISVLVRLITEKKGKCSASTTSERVV